jgi:hypothetical protein
MGTTGQESIGLNPSPQPPPPIAEERGRVRGSRMAVKKINAFVLNFRGNLFAIFLNPSLTKNL